MDKTLDERCKEVIKLHEDAKCSIVGVVALEEKSFFMAQLIRDMQEIIKGLEIQTGAYKSLLKSMEESEPSYRKSYHKAVADIEKLTSKANSVDSERDMNAALTAENLRLEEENERLRYAIKASALNMSLIYTH